LEKRSKKSEIRQGKFDCALIRLNVLDGGRGRKKREKMKK